MTTPWSKLLLGIYLIATISFLLWSYALTDPNLVLTSFAPYWNLQQWLWKYVWQQPHILSATFLIIMMAWFGSYVGLIRSFSKKAVSLRSYLLVVCISSLLTVFAYNALSHDVFNYIFNAKMVLIYQSNPHIHTALEFPHDLWTRFMHNTHTPAPYGYGWTALSVLPFFFTQNSFTLSWLVFKALNLFALVLLRHTLTRLNKHVFQHHKNDFEQKSLIVFANPLLIVETLSTGHNDLWMMVPALVAFLAVMNYQQTKKLWHMLVAALAFVFSLSTKWATLTLSPILLLLATWQWLEPQFLRLPAPLKHLMDWFKNNWPTLASIALFVPLSTARSQQFHPWYLVWVLVWLPLMRRQFWFDLVLVFSFSSMLRYLPWLLAGGYSPQVLLEQKLITWGIPALWLIMRFAYAKIAPAK